MDEHHFAQLLVAALAKPAVCQGFQSVMRPLIAGLEEKLDNSINRVDNLEIAMDETNTKVTVMDQKLDDLEQYSRKDNIRIVGIADNRTPDNYENTPKKVVSFFNEALQLNLTQYDINNAHRLGPKGKGKFSSDIIVKLSSNIVKQDIMRNRKKLKHLDHRIYINEDLTQLRASLYKKAREQVKHKHLYTAWTRDGNIFVKLHDNSKATKITKEKDLADLTRL